jgi:phosphoesterase RecJ-like protein
MRNENNILREAVRLISESHSIAILSHFNPDPDAYGSSCGLAHIVRSIMPICDVRVFNEDADTAQERLAFLSGAEDVSASPGDFQPALIITCDSGELNRVGDELEQWVLLNQEVPLINIDHHESNNNFGTINVVQTGASSTSELVVDLFRVWNDTRDARIEMPNEAAECLLAGILGDTGAFRYRSTTADTLEKSAYLIRAGARLDYLTNHLFGSVPISTMKMNGIGLQKMRTLCGGRIAGVAITDEDYATVGGGPKDAEELAELFRDIEGVEVSYSLRWVDGKWKASLRTARADVDLAAVATSFGGGGHRAAAAFRASGELSDILTRLECALEKALLEVKEPC